MIDTQQDILSSYDDTMRSQRETIQQQQDAIGSLRAEVLHQKEYIDEQEAIAVRAEEQSDRQMNTLKEIATIRDVQEDKLDAKTEEIKDLKATVKAMQARLERIASREAEIQTSAQDMHHEPGHHCCKQTKPTEPKGTQELTSNVTDEQMYRRLREAGEIDVAAKLLASARHLDRLMAPGRAWIYQNHEGENQSPSEDGKDP